MNHDWIQEAAREIQDELFDSSGWELVSGPVNFIAQAAAIISRHLSGTEQSELARNQPCGCVVCICEDEERCHGCGARHCGTHPVGKIPSPVFALSQTSDANRESK